MEDESFLSCQTRTQFEPITEHRVPDLSFTSSRSFNEFISLQEARRDPQSSSQLLTQDAPKKKLTRCKTAPAMVVLQDLRQKSPDVAKPQSSSIIRQGICLLMIHHVHNRLRRHHTDIPSDQDLQENTILTGLVMGPQGSQEGFSARNYIVDVAKGRMRIRLKVGLALGVVVLCIGIGSLVLHFVEDLTWIDSIYLSVMSVTTVGYGDRAFKTLPGRLFAAIWLLFSTLMVARAFLYLAEARIDKRHRRIAKSVLHRDMTVEDLLAATINNTGFISKSEYVIFKLKEMGKIREKDILQICDQFHKLDSTNSGKITLPHLLEGRS
ncbi:hypothetical protein K1719_035380 [Acacia pycnantha]|nr:hypothetical protein K1719_035380 [Acacia pycnantha]